MDAVGGAFQSGKWYGASALGSVSVAPLLEQLQHSGFSTNRSTTLEDHQQPTAAEKLKSLVQDCGLPPHKLAELVQDLPPKSVSDTLVNFYFAHINYTRYPLYEPAFRVSYDSIWTNGARVSPSDARFLPLLFVVMATAVRLAPEHIAGDARTRRITSLRYYWSCKFSHFAEILSDYLRACPSPTGAYASSGDPKREPGIATGSPSGK
jgi:hypothetical protein